ncbi:MAG: POTRA domain-containing protein [Phycisphaerales bacterium]|jgi:outer membrane protein insertion porin family|nr:POTRA domain-containing protein [Phycisphaerales bacterium]
MRFIIQSIVILIALFSTTTQAMSSTELEDRLISAVKIEGLLHVEDQFVENNIRTAVGDPYDPLVVEEDVRRLTRLGRFKPIDSKVVLQDDGTVHIVYVLVEQQIIASVNVVGNKLVSDAELLAVVPMVAGVARDTFLIDKGRRAIAEKYRKLGNYLVEVEVDAMELDEAGVLIYKIMEGPRVRVKSVRFEGNKSFSSKQLSAEIETSVAVPFLRRGELDEFVLDDDVAILGTYYRDRGFLEARVGRVIERSTDNRSANVVFQIDEGLQFTVGEVRAETRSGEPLTVFSSEQIASLIPLKRGDIYKSLDIQASEKAIVDAYGVLGHIEMNVQAAPIQAGDGPVKNILFLIQEGVEAKVGLVHIKGNLLTKDEVIRGRIRLKPGRRFDGAEPERARTRLLKTRLFNDVKVTPQPENPDNPGYRDLLVEVKEMQTGSMNFGIMAGSDNGIMGEISLTQRNFDVADLPESWSEFWQGKAFRGAGQGFAMSFQPGDEVFNYQISLNDPRFLQTDYSVGGSVGYTRRVYTDYNEEKVYSKFSVGRKFGDIWSGKVFLAGNRVELTDVDSDVPLEIFNDRGPATVDTIGLTATRTTLYPYVGPQKGSRLEFGLSQAGLLTSDYTFTKSFVNYTTYFTVDRDFLGRATTLRLDGKLGYIFDGDAPTYDHFYMGGRSFRGFDFRTISPKGTPRVAGGSTDIPIGGDWKIFLGAQYEMPVVGTFLSTVFFCDTGTVTDSPGFDDYRVSVGTGIRLRIPQLGQAPLAFDFGFPVVKQEEDEKKVFSFSIQMPF